MKKLESGRSMVEMLGVLAIIGVLSIGGISGYTLSMRRHRANGVADAAAKYALVAYGKCQQDILNGNSGGCDDNYMSFADAGIGDAPAGVQSMKIDDIDIDGSGGVDTVKVKVGFEDLKLCQALASIAGSSCNSSNKQVVISIKQN